ncbi:retrovirus-related pol polyprotein from transposon TNT 1-94 [Tanacetum coccineum]|uniref:Retrovirus-related pol polyprotein from transposon TNT 1-94 n=1 Tax=Tanacetum coccineum TaxID=301880 RepID=A0ABQ4YMI0_9ASTR
MSTPTFSDTHNMVAFLENPAESDGFHEIIDFLNANQIHYALTVNPTIYTPYIEQFWATAKIKTVNEEHQLQALVDKKKVIITETSIRSDLHVEDAGGIDCLPTATIFKELARMGAKTIAWNEFSSTMASAIIYLATNQKFNLSKYIFDAMLGDMSHHKKIYVNSSHTKKIFANMKREGKDFSGRVTPLSATMMVQANQEEGSRRKQKNTIIVPHPSDSTVDVLNKESVPTHSNDLLLSGEDRLKLTDLVGVTRRVEYSDDESLGAQKDASNQGRSIEDIDKDAKISLVDETQGRSDDAEMFNTDNLIGNEVFAKNDMIEKDQDVIPKEVSTAAPFTTVVSSPVITERTTTIAPSTIPKAKGITFRDAGESITKIPTSVSSSSIKDKGKAKMDKPEVPLKKKDQIALDEEMDRNLEAQIQVEFIEEERLSRKKEEEANIALIESWDNTQAMMEADFELAQRLQAEEQGEITIEERSRLFVEHMNKRKKHFAKLRAEEKRRKPPTKAQKRNLMSTCLKNMEVMKSNEGTEESSKRTEDELKPDKSKKAESSEKKAEGSRKKSIGKKRAGKEQKQESSKRQRMEDDKETDKHKEAEEDDEAKMKKHMENISREDLETLWKLVKTKHGNTRPEDDYEKVFWGDLKVITAGTKVNAAGLQLLEELLLDTSGSPFGTWIVDAQGVWLVSRVLHKYIEQLRPKVVFGDKSSCITKGYGSINYGGIVFSKVAFVNGLKYNLISISQLCDAKYIVQFDDKQGIIFNANKEIVLIALRRNDVYVLDMSLLTPNEAYFFAKASKSVNWLWNKRLSISISRPLINLPNKTKFLAFLHLFIQRINHAQHVKKESIRELLSKLNKIYQSGNTCIFSIWIYLDHKQIRTDNETEFKNSELESFYDEKGISQNFSSPYTSEQNGVAERKNKTLIEATRTMPNGSVLSKHLWTEAIRFSCYTKNRSIIIKRHDKTPYEIFRERILDISYFHVFGCHVFIHNHKDYLGKFDANADDGVDNVEGRG